MLKSTDHTLSKEQFRKLREARRLIKEELDEDFSLHSEAVVQDLYACVLRSESNELFDLFTDLHRISDNSVARPLNREQFILLREARGLIAEEFSQPLPLGSDEVMDRLYEFALQSAGEDLFDIFAYLHCRPDQSVEAATAPRLGGAQLARFREARQLIKEQFGDDLTVAADTLLDTLYQYALRSEEGSGLVDAVDFLKSWTPAARGTAEIMFAALSAEDFARLRGARKDIEEEFAETLSLHTPSALEDLYGFALRSEGEGLFDLFSDLFAAQKMSRRMASAQWLSKEQFMLLRTARGLIRTEFDEQLMLAADDVLDELYQFALRSEKEALFDLCAKLHDLRRAADSAPNATGGDGLLSREQFMMLRRARSLVKEEFAEELKLQSDVVLADLYRFAVRSDGDDLFDLHAELAVMRPVSGRTAERDVSALSKDEFVVLRKARAMVKAEFDKELALDAEDVLDQLYDFALQSEGEELFDLHAKLNNRAAPAVEPVQASSAPAEPEAKTSLKRIISMFGTRPAERPAHALASAGAGVPDNDAVPETRPTQDRSAQEDIPVLGVEAALQASVPEPSGRKAPKRVIQPARVKPRATEHPAGDSGVSVYMPGDEPAVPGNGGDTAAERVEATATDDTSQHGETEWPQEADPVETWHVSSLDGRLGVRLLSELNIGMLDGEVLLGAPGGAPLCATINLIDDQPILFVKDAEVLINDDPVINTCKLASGDKIWIGTSALRIDCLAPAKLQQEG